MDNNFEEIEKEVAKKLRKRDKKKKPSMKVSGKQVFKLNKIIGKK